MGRILLGAALGLALIGPAGAQTSSDWSRCRAIPDSLDRLRCYDGMAAAPAEPAAGEYASMTLLDWKTDMAALRDKKVEVSGLVMPFAGGGLMTVGPGDSSPVFVGVELLPRDQRKRLLGCHPTCSATVRGYGGTVMMQMGLVADSIAFR